MFRHKGVASALALAFGGFLIVPATANAQHAHKGTEHSTSDPSHTMASPPEQPLSARAREQIADVERAVAALNTPDAAAAAGFEPALGLLPTMGMHRVNEARVLDDVDLLKPDFLMFGLVGGERRLIGVAYGFVGQVADAPDLFDGTQDSWHGHPEFAPPGQSLVMLHLWFVPSPGGPFAGHNPWLGYWATGVQLPADSLAPDAGSVSRSRRLGLALAETVEPLPVALGGQAAPLAQTPGVDALRDSIRTMIPHLNAARQAGDQAAWDREADAMITKWERIRDLYLEAIPIPDPRERLAVFYRQMETGEHEH